MAGPAPMAGPAGMWANVRGMVTVIATAMTGVTDVSGVTCVTGLARVARLTCVTGLARVARLTSVPWLD